MNSIHVYTDRDECRLGFGTICGPGRCVNTPGRFMCECTPPFVPAYNATWCARKYDGCITCGYFHEHTQLANE